MKSFMKEFIAALDRKRNQYHSERVNQYCELNETKKEETKEEDQRTNTFTE